MSGKKIILKTIILLLLSTSLAGAAHGDAASSIAVKIVFTSDMRGHISPCRH